jgi:Flp pilus assembly protein TadG
MKHTRGVNEHAAAKTDARGGRHPLRTGMWRRETGQVVILTTLLLPVLIGCCAIVIDVGSAFAQRRSLQQAADAAALAGAQRLPCGDLETACLNAAGAVAAAYSRQNGGPSTLTACTGPSDSDCYEVIERVKMRVRLKTTIPTFFAAFFGKKNWDISAKSAASWMPYTSTTPGSTVTIPGSTNPDVVNVQTTTTPGVALHPTLLFAGSPSCAPSPAVDLQGSGSRYDGAVVSNGSIDAPSNNMGGGPLVYANPPNCGVNLGNTPSWGTPIVQAPAPWPVPPPVCETATSPPGVNACNPTTASLNELITTVGGVPCTAAPANWTITAAPAPGLYCASQSITVKHSFTNVGLVAPLITVSGSGNVVSGTSLLPAYGGLLFYAYGNGGNPASEVDRVTISSATGGTFTLTFNGQTTGPLAFDATAGTVQTALQGLSSIGSGNVSVASSVVSTNRFYDVTFSGSLAMTDVGAMTVGASLTPVGASASVATTTQGFPDGPTGNSVANQSGSGFGFAGAMFAPFGRADLTASGTVAVCPDPTVAGCGFIQAWMIKLAGSGKSFQGLGPGTPGPPTVSTTTTTIPGSTNPGTVTTNPDTVNTVGTGSNLVE